MGSPKLKTRERVLDAAEHLLSNDSTAFSMRDLASAADLSFATPFNHFGSKSAIMRALSARRIALMRERFAESVLPEDAIARVRMAVEIAVAVMLIAPTVNRAIMAGIGGPANDAGEVLKDSSLLWTDALGAGIGFDASTLSLAMSTLPVQLAIIFRGVLSFWTAGEISDQDLASEAQLNTSAALLGFAEKSQRDGLLRGLGRVRL